MRVKDYITIALQLLTVGLLIHDKIKADDIDDRLQDVEEDIYYTVWRKMQERIR